MNQTNNWTSAQDDFICHGDQSDCDDHDDHDDDKHGQKQDNDITLLMITMIINNS